MSKFLNDKYVDFEAYTPGEQPRDMQYVKLNTNESPYPPAPLVINALQEADIELLRLYPDPTGRPLKEKIAARYDVKPENVFLSNGSDDIINFAFMAFCSEKTGVCFPDITYSFYDVVAALHGIKYERIPLSDEMTINIKDYFGLGKTIAIPNPNAPTGIALTPDEIEEIVKNNPDNLVLIDEAYVDFGAESVIPLTKKYDNLLVAQTYSKSRSLAGGRLGYAIAAKDIIDDMEKIKYSTNPYNINRLTMYLAEVSLDADEYYMDNCRKIEETREYTTKELEKLGFKVFPSKANFIFAGHKTVDGGYIYEELKKRGVLVRHFTNEKINNYNRISIGTKEQMDVLLEKIREIIK